MTDKFKSSAEMGAEAASENRLKLEAEVGLASYINSLDQGLELMDGSNEAFDEAAWEGDVWQNQ